MVLLHPLPLFPFQFIHPAFFQSRLVPLPFYDTSIAEIEYQFLIRRNNNLLYSPNKQFFIKFICTQNGCACFFQSGLWNGAIGAAVCPLALMRITGPVFTYPSLIFPNNMNIAFPADATFDDDETDDEFDGDILEGDVVEDNDSDDDVIQEDVVEEDIVEDVSDEAAAAETGTDKAKVAEVPEETAIDIYRVGQQSSSRVIARIQK